MNTSEAQHVEWIGLDVGGANIKWSDGLQRSGSLPFALWRDPTGLAAATHTAIRDLSFDGLALTMTGELADCFETKAEGVKHIVRSVLGAATGKHLRIATVDDQWLTPDGAIRETHRVAAANWRLLARYGARLIGEGPGLVVDTGSTTVDILPTRDGSPRTIGQNDTQRLLAGELVYTGIRRTPVCAVVDALPYRGRLCPVAAELFATVDDAWLTLGVAQESNSIDTADGRPRLPAYARARLARCVCADPVEFTQSDAIAAAEAIVTAQTQLVAEAITKQTRRGAPRRVLLCGEGETLARMAIDTVGFKPTVLRLSDHAGEHATACAPAFAAAVLAREETHA